MADKPAPKDAKKPAGGGGYLPLIMLSVLLGVGVLVFFGQSKTSPNPLTYLNVEYLFYKIYEFFLWLWHVFLNGSLYGTVAVFLGILTVLVAIVAAYAYIRTKELEDAQQKELKNFTPTAPVATGRNERWERIETLITTENENDWRQAIIEADIILDEMVARMNYKGADLAERLKNVEPSDFTSLQDAWEAHKVRNRIAHDGSAFSLSKHEAKRVIDLYENVFKEFKYI